MSNNILLTNNSTLITSQYNLVYTDSPYIKEYTKNSYYLDDLLDDEFHSSLSFYQEKCKNLDKAILDVFFPKYNDGFKKFISTHSFYTVFIIRVYKLLKLKEKYLNDKITISITKDELYEINSIVQINRFANLYYWIVDTFKLDNFELLLDNQVISCDDVKDKPIDSIFLRLINIDFSVLKFNLLRKIQLTKKNKERIFLYKTNHTTREIEPYLHEKRVSYINLPKLYNSSVVSSKILIDSLQLNNLINKLFSDKNEFESLFSDVIERVLYYRINIYLMLESEVLENIKNIDSSASKYMLTNTLNGFDELILARILQNNGFKIIDSMHGLTISYHIKQNLYHHEIDCCDMLLCFNKSDKKMYQKRNNNKEIKFISTSQEEKKVSFYSLQRKYVENMLNLKNDINVFYPSVIFPFNNDIFFGYDQDEGGKFKFEIDMIDILSSINKKTIYKKYPSRCYIDKNPIDKLADSSTNIKVIEGNYDFRYIRVLGDIFVFTHLGTSSTIAWILGVNKPTIYLHSNKIKCINEEAKKIVYECFIVINIDDSDWQIQLTNMLNKPYQELKRMWQDKQKYRDLYDEEWLMGTKMHAGKLGAKYIKEFMDINDAK